MRVCNKFRCVLLFVVTLIELIFIVLKVRQMQLEGIVAVYILLKNGKKENETGGLKCTRRLQVKFKVDDQKMTTESL